MFAWMTGGDILPAVTLTILCALFLWWMVITWLNERGTTLLDDYRAVWQSRMKGLDLTLHELPTGDREQSPCSVEWVLEGGNVRYVAKGHKMLQTCRALYHRRIKPSELESKSVFLCERVPR